MVTGFRGDLPPKRLAAAAMTGLTMTGVAGWPNVLYLLLKGHKRDRDVLCVKAPHTLHGVLSLAFLVRFFFDSYHLLALCVFALLRFALYARSPRGASPHEQTLRNNRRTRFASRLTNRTIR